MAATALHLEAADVIFFRKTILCSFNALLQHLRYPIINCLLAASAAMTPRVFLNEEHSSYVRILAWLVVLDVLIRPRVKIIKQLKNGEINLDDLILSNKNTFKNMSSILAGTCFITMEGLILIFVESESNLMFKKIVTD